MVGRDQAAEQQRQRFRELVSAELYERLWRQAAWLTSCREDAKDLLQDSLATAFSRLLQLRDSELAGPWLMAIMRRTWLNQLRSRRRRKSRELLLRDDRTPVVAAGPESQDELARDALARLKQDDRWLLTMHYIEDVDTRELAAALRLGEAAVRKRLSRARRALKQVIDKLQGGG
jgi:RNA polymerase sigma-70 factor (ECF subfamily)